jgi:hypothetical protein
LLTAAEATAVAVVAGAAAAVADAALARAGVDSDRAAAGVHSLAAVSPGKPGSGMPGTGITSLRRSTAPLATVLPLAVAAPATYLVGRLFLP